MASRCTLDSQEDLTDFIDQCAVCGDGVTTESTEEPQNSRDIFHDESKSPPATGESAGDDDYWSSTGDLG